MITHPFARTDEEILADSLSRSSRGTVFLPNEITIVSVTPLPNTTAATVTFRHTNAHYDGEMTIEFDRIAIGQYLRDLDMTLHAPWCETTHDLLDLINKKYQLALKPSDVFDAPLPKDAIGEVTLTMTPHCFLWVGTFRVDLVNQKVASQTQIQPGMKVSLEYPADIDPHKAIAEIGLGPLDTRAIGEYLTHLKVNERIGLQGGRPLSFTAANDPIPWRMYPKENKNHNVYGARVLYNGLNEGIFKTPNKNHLSICVLALSQWCRDYTGRLVLVYDTQHPMVRA